MRVNEINRRFSQPNHPIRKIDPFATILFSDIPYLKWDTLRRGLLSGRRGGFARPRFDYLYHGGCCIELGWSMECWLSDDMIQFFTASSDQKGVIDGICWWCGGGRGREKEYANSSCQRMGKVGCWLFGHCSWCVQNNKNKKLVESGGYRRVRCVIDKESFRAIQDGK